MRFNRLLIDNKIGTLTAFVSNYENDLFGLSAFHVLRGRNNSIDDEEIIQIRNTTGRWIKFGRTKHGQYDTGSGQYGNFGKLDYAIFKLQPVFKKRIENKLKAMPMSELFQFNNIKQIIGTKVQAFSEENQDWISGTISDIHHETSTGKLFDVKIEINNGITTINGDSGMLWKDEYGHALFMHTDGGVTNRIGYSYCTIISRIIVPNNYNLMQIDGNLIS